MPEMREKKSERIEIRLPYSNKKAFIEACELQGDTPSRALRRFIDSYVRRADIDTIRGIFRSFFRILMRPVPMAAMGLLITLIISTFFLKPSEVKARSYFSIYDANLDGELDGTELAVSAEQLEMLLLALDNDGSNSLSKSEFQGKGEIVIAEHKPGNLNAKGNQAIEGQLETTRLVKFDLRNPENIEISIWAVDMKSPSFHADIIKFVELTE